MALAKYTSQSEIGHDESSQSKHLVDGRTFVILGRSVMVTTSVGHYWWHVDLQHSYTIGTVTIHKEEGSS